jgi:MFS family permease
MGSKAKGARIAGFYTSSFTIGTALSFLLGQLGTEMGWRVAFIAAGLLGLAAALLARAWLPRSPDSKLERSHEGYPLGNARGQILGRQFVESTTGATCFHVIPLAFADPGQNQAARILKRTCTKPAGPAAVMPGHANRNMVQG